MLRRTAGRGISSFDFGHPKLTQHFGGITGPAKATASDKGIQVSTLPNGVKVVTHDREGAQATVGMYAEAGAKYDPITAPGLNYVLRWAMLTSNFDSTLFQIDRQFRALGAAYEHVEVAKRWVGWKTEVRRDFVEPPVATIATCIAAPRFPDSDVERFRDTMDNILQERRWKEPHLYVVDELEGVAFWKEPLGNPRYVPVFSNDSCNQATLSAQWASLFQPSRIVLAGVNVKHDEIISAYNSAAYPHSASAPHHARAAAPKLGQTEEKLQYRPGTQYHEQEYRAKVTGTSSDMRVDTIAAIGWLTNGREGTVKEFAVSSVVRELLNQVVAASTSFVHDNDADGIRAFYRPYATAGLIGYSVKGPTDGIQAAVQGLRLPAAKDIDADLAAAKTTAVVRFYGEQLEVQRDYLDFLALSKFSTDEVTNAIGQVTAADVKAELEAMRGKEPCLFATGELHAFPSLKQLGLKA